MWRYIYQNKNNELFINFFIPSSTETKINKNNISIKQITNYPVEEQINLEISPKKESIFTVNLRIPEWSKENIILINGDTIKDNIDKQLKIM